MKITKEFFSQLVARELDFQGNFQNEAWDGGNHTDEKWLAMLLTEFGTLSECVSDGNEGCQLDQMVRMAGMLQAWVLSRNFDVSDGKEFEAIQETIRESYNTRNGVRTESRKGA